MRRQLVAQAAQRAAFPRIAQLLPQRDQFAQQQVDLLLLAEHGFVQPVDQVLGEGELHFEFGEAVLDRVRVGPGSLAGLRCALLNDVLPLSRPAEPSAQCSPRSERIADAPAPPGIG